MVRKLLYGMVCQCWGRDMRIKTGDTVYSPLHHRTLLVISANKCEYHYQSGELCSYIKHGGCDLVIGTCICVDPKDTGFLNAVFHLCCLGRKEWYQKIRKRNKK